MNVIFFKLKNEYPYFLLFSGDENSAANSTVDYWGQCGSVV